MITEFNELHEFMKDEHLDKTLAVVVKLLMNPDVPAGSPTWNKFVIRSWADVELYTYAKYLYTEQSILFI